MNILKSFPPIFCLLVSMPLCAVDLAGEAGVHFGGDTMVTVTDSDGKTDSLRAGEELSLAAGAAFRIGESMALTATFGMKKEAVFPDDGSITFTRYPFNLLLLYRSGKWRFGGGLTVHMNPVYKADTGTDRRTVEFKNAPGVLLDAHYFVIEDVYVAGRYTWIEYEVENDPAATSYNGSSIGILVGIQL